jgi:hypothetical protein
VAGEREVALAGQIASDGDHHSLIRRQVDTRATASRQVNEPEPLGRPDPPPVIGPPRALAETSARFGAGQGWSSVEQQGQPSPLHLTVSSAALLGDEPGLADLPAGEAGLPLGRHAALPIAHSRGRMAKRVQGAPPWIGNLNIPLFSTGGAPMFAPHGRRLEPR